MATPCSNGTVTRPLGLHTGQIVKLDGHEWRVDVFIPEAQGRRKVVLESTTTTEVVIVPMPEPRHINRTGRCLAETE